MCEPVTVMATCTLPYWVFATPPSMVRGRGAAGLDVLELPLLDPLFVWVDGAADVLPARRDASLVAPLVDAGGAGGADRVTPPTASCFSVRPAAQDAAMAVALATPTMTDVVFLTSRTSRRGCGGRGRRPDGLPGARGTSTVAGRRGTPRAGRGRGRGVAGAPRRNRCRRRPRAATTRARAVRRASRGGGRRARRAPRARRAGAAGSGRSRGR